MRLGKFEHAQPTTLDGVCTLLAQYKDKARVNAGGTDLLARMKQRLVEPEIVIDIKRVGDIGGIRTDGGDLHIGATVALADIAKSPAVREQAPILAEAAAAVGAKQLQNMGTLGGNICLDTRCWYYNQSHAWRQSREACLKVGGDVCHMARGSKRCYALYSGDTAPALLALDAKVRLASSREERIVALEDFFVDDGMAPATVQSDELLAEVIIPGATGRRSGAYLKFRRREAIDFPVVGVATTLALDGDTCQRVRVAVTGVISMPFLATDSQAVLAGKPLNKELIEQASEAAFKQARPVSHMEVSAAYRKRLVRVLVKDALSQFADLA